MIDGIHTRSIRSEDISGITEINKRIIGKERALSWQENVDEYFRIFPLLGIVAEKDNKIIGFLLGDTSNWKYGLSPSVWIEVIGVAPEFQRKGIGKILVEAFCRHCYEEGYHSVQALIRNDDSKLVEFYKATGFGAGRLVNYERKIP